MLPSRLIRMVPGRVVLSWLATGALVGLIWWQYQARMIHWAGWLFLLIAALAICTAGLAVMGGFHQLVLGPKRAQGVFQATLGIAPPCALVGTVLMGLMQANSGIITPSATFVIALGSAMSVAEVILPWTYTHRLATDRVVMFFDTRICDPWGDLAAMDAHVRRMEQHTGLALRSPIHWVRGPLLGKQAMALPGFALGSAQSPAGPLDRHELAHVVLIQHMATGTIPPMLLNEGWAQFQAYSAQELAQHAAWLRDFLFSTCPNATPEQLDDILDSTSDPVGYRLLYERACESGQTSSFSYLNILTSDEWYGRDKQPVYSIGGAFASYIIRYHSTAAFIELALATRPGTFPEVCQQVLGRDLAELERDLWRDVDEQLALATK